MVDRASNKGEVLRHSDDSPVETATPSRLKYEKEDAADFKGESIAFRPKIEDIDFEEEEKKDYVENVVVYVEENQYVAWKVIYSDRDFVYSHLVPWNRILKLEYSFRKFGDSSEN